MSTHGAWIGRTSRGLVTTAWRQRHVALLRRLLALLLVIAVAAPLTGPANSAQAVDVAAAPVAQDCLVAGPVDRFGPQIEDFGGGGSPYIKRVDMEYWSGRGYLVGFDRKVGDSYIESRRGGYVFTGIVLATGPVAASDDLKEAMAGWTTEWASPQPVPLAGVGDEALVVERMTTWEAAPGEPMTEVLLGFRRCNVSGVILLAVMPKFGPIEQAARYARIIIGKVA